MKMELNGPARGHDNSIPQCCCGRTDCPFLAHSCKILATLERDVRTAAQLGQALLVRHETYMADTERERARMTASIEKLEQEKRDLETKNAQTIEENHHLSDQLESANTALTESDAQIASLTATLLSTQQELQRVTALAARAEYFERQLIQLEKDQADLHNTLEMTVDDERTAVQRWRQAERTILALYDQIERIEREAKEERERHVEVVGRMERRRAVEREFETAAGRLKGAAGTKTVDRDKNGSNVVSHFVKDILQDNANLQLGIVELREMLLNSNEEVERLREQLMLHQPISPPVAGFTLQKELGLEPVQNQELHVHHHFHTPDTTVNGSKMRPPHQRRVGKKRRILTPGHFTPPSGAQTPRTASSRPRLATLSSAASILSHTSVTIPEDGPAPNRWSMQSYHTALSAAPSTVPSSPYSHSNRTSSVFDRMFSDNGMDSSRPTSPESYDADSPFFLPTKPSSSSKPPLRSFSTSATLQLKADASTALSSTTDNLPSSRPDLPAADPPIHPPIPEEQEQEQEQEQDPPGPTRPLLPRRAASHESLLSVSGMDIHTLQSRPSQLLVSGGRAFAPSLASSMSASASASASSKPVLCNMTATARPSLSGRESRTSQALLQGMAMERGGAMGVGARGREGSGWRVGGWVLGRWGGAPAPAPSLVGSGSASASGVAGSASASFSIAEVRPQSNPTAPKPAQKLPPPSPRKMRPPGVNQAGLVWGVGAKPKVVGRVQVSRVDVEALTESLEEVEGMM